MNQLSELTRSVFLSHNCPQGISLCGRTRFFLSCSRVIPRSLSRAAWSKLHCCSGQVSTVERGSADCAAWGQDPAPCSSLLLWTHAAARYPGNIIQQESLSPVTAPSLWKKGKGHCWQQESWWWGSEQPPELLWMHPVKVSISQMVRFLQVTVVQLCLDPACPGTNCSALNLLLLGSTPEFLILLIWVLTWALGFFKLPK